MSGTPPCSSSRASVQHNSQCLHRHARRLEVTIKKQAYCISSGGLASALRGGNAEAVILHQRQGVLQTAAPAVTVVV